MLQPVTDQIIGAFEHQILFLSGQQSVPHLMTSSNLVLVTDTCFDEHKVAAVCKCNIATSIVQQAAKTSKLSSCVAKIVEMLASKAYQRDELDITSPQQIHNKSYK